MSALIDKVQDQHEGTGSGGGYGGGGGGGKKREVVAFFGSSVNPPTGKFGHGGIVDTLAATNKFDEIWINPVFRHIYAAKRGLQTFEHRKAMCELNWKHCIDGGVGKDEGVVVEQVEKEEVREPSYASKLWCRKALKENYNSKNPEHKLSAYEISNCFFDLFDSNKNGFIDVEEMKNGLKEIEGSSAINIEDLFAAIDTDGDTQIDRGEFSEFFVDSRDNSTSTTSTSPTTNTLSTNNNNTRVSVSEVERMCVEGNLFEGDSCGTIDVLTYLRKEYPEKEFQLVLGFDSFDDICNKKWKHGDRILETTHINVFRRGLIIDPEKYKDYNVTFYDLSAEPYSSSSSSLAVPDVSSTLIRDKFKYVYDNNLEESVLRLLESNDRLGGGRDKVADESHDIGILFDANYINPLVAAYIIRNRLFSVAL